MYNTTLPAAAATIDEPEGQGISIPLWFLDAPGIPVFLGPNFELILLVDGQGQDKVPALGWIALVKL